MSTPLSSQELVRLSWLTELRRQGHRQCVGSSKPGGKVCALMLLSEIAGCHPSLPWYHPDIAGAAGLSMHQAGRVAAMNDGMTLTNPVSKTFAEIADVVEGWFKR